MKPMRNCRSLHFVHAICLLSGALAALPVVAADAGLAPQEIRQVIGKTWDKPDAAVDTGPVVVSGDWAVAGWTQGERGGRALLQRLDGSWSVVLCAGAALRQTDMLVDAGVPPATARSLAERLVTAESGVAEDRRRRFDLFGPPAAVGSQGTNDGRAPAATGHGHHHH